MSNFYKYATIKTPPEIREDTVTFTVIPTFG